MWKRGLNFAQSKYNIIDKTTFVPHVRSNYHVSIPKTIIDGFDSPVSEVALIEITDISTGKTSKRIKKLSEAGNSKVITFKAERKIKKPMIKGSIIIHPLKRILKCGRTR